MIAIIAISMSAMRACEYKEPDSRLLYISTATDSSLQTFNRVLPAELHRLVVLHRIHGTQSPRRMKKYSLNTVKYSIGDSAAYASNGVSSSRAMRACRDEALGCRQRESCSISERASGTPGILTGSRPLTSENSGIAAEIDCREYSRVH